MKSFSLSSPDINITISYAELLSSLKERQIPLQKIDPVQIAFQGVLFDGFPQMDILVIHIGKSIRQVVVHFIHDSKQSLEEATNQFHLLQKELAKTFGQLLPDDVPSQAGVVKSDKFDNDDFTVMQILYDLDGFHENLRMIFKPSVKEVKKIQNQPKNIILIGSIVFFLAMFLTFGFAFQFDWYLFIICFIGSVVGYIALYLAFFVLKVGIVPQYPKPVDRRLTRFEKKFHEPFEAKFVGQVEVGKGLTHGMIQANIYFFHTHLLLSTLIMGKVNVIDKFFEDIVSVHLVQNMIQLKYGDDITVNVYLKEVDQGNKVIRLFEQKKAQLQAFKR